MVIDTPLLKTVVIIEQVDGHQDSHRPSSDISGLPHCNTQKCKTGGNEYVKAGLLPSRNHQLDTLLWNKQRSDQAGVIGTSSKSGSLLLACRRDLMAWSKGSPTFPCSKRQIGVGFKDVLGWSIWRERGPGSLPIAENGHFENPVYCDGVWL
jgi:hypothetical protein